MIASLALVCLAGPVSSPIQWSLRIVDREFPFGAPIRVELMAKNLSKTKQCLAKSLWDGAPAGGSHFSFCRNGQEVEVFGKDGTPSVQVMVNNKVNADRFMNIHPGKEVVVNWMVIEGEYDFGGSTSRLKADYAKARPLPLQPGKLEVTGWYEFEPKKLIESYRRDWNQTIEFGPGAKTLWDRALPLKVSAQAVVVIRPK